MPIESAVFSFEQAAQRLRQASKPLLLTHERVDGDAVGSMVALQAMLKSQGIESLAVLYDPLPESLGFLCEPGDLRLLGQDVTTADLDACDLIVLLDTCSYAQLRPVADWLRHSNLPKLAIDHHMTRDEAADDYLTDDTASATCLILHELANQVGWTLSPRVAVALFVGIATDTGWFRHSNTDGRTLTAISDMVRQGINPHELHQRLFMQDTVGSLRLLGPAIDSLSILCDERVAIIALPASAFKAANAQARDTEGLVNEPLRVGSICVSILLVETEEGLIKGSFRSKPPSSVGDPDIDVAALTATFGGGGHKRAAGARFPTSLEHAREKVIASITNLLTA